MRKKRWLTAFLLCVLALAAGKALVVKVQQTNILSKPDFLSSSLQALKKGDRLELEEETGGWYLVKSPSGVRGYIHKSAVETTGSSLTGIMPGQKSASDQEVALAAKGFSEENEKKIKGSKGYNFADLEWVMSHGMPRAEVKGFIQEGRLK